MKKDSNQSYQPKVVLAWASHKRHIIVDNMVVCQHERKAGSYNPENALHIALFSQGIPQHIRKQQDSRHTHTDGIIEYAPLAAQKYLVNLNSICQKCQGKFAKLFKK